ncbi:MAG: hypothetical protein RLZZ86_4172 [Cyanobacteriota bacterium]
MGNSESQTRNYDQSYLRWISRFIKLVLDRFVAFIGIIFLFPILIIVAGAIYLRMGSPILFIQPRPGKNARIFNFYKFRTMTNEKDEKGNLLSDEQRLTSFGDFIRKTRRVI